MRSNSSSDSSNVRLPARASFIFLFASSRLFDSTDDLPLLEPRHDALAGLNLAGAAQDARILFPARQTVAPRQHVERAESLQPRRLPFELLVGLFDAAPHRPLQAVAPKIELPFFLPDAFQRTSQARPPGQFGQARPRLLQ